jgi:TetR/AcrR family transcriptional regulator, regulator of cefoperazone and chloramphenicol sensitivity
VPRDSSGTKERLVHEAERLFARRGLYQVTIREITEAAHQRNTSAVNYHFGSREGLLDVILRTHGDPTDEERGKTLALVGSAATTRQLLAALVVPYGAHLRTASGRDYLRIVAQMTSSFGTWSEDRPGTGPWLQRILAILESRPRRVPAAIRKERLVEMIMLMTAAMAERARAIEDGTQPSLDEATFLGNLTDVLVGVLEAPLNGPLPQLP